VCLSFCRAAAEAGVPAGVLNLVHGGGPGIAGELCRHPEVDMITLTGGTRAGSAVMRAAAPTIKNLLLELGGKSAHIVLADADLERAIPAVAAGIFRNSGQRCLAGSRLVVEEAVADRLERGVAEIAESLVVGDPFDEATQVGAMIDGEAIAGVEAFVARAREHGLEIAAGGGRLEELAPGFFYRPTVLLGAGADSPAAREEVFGPVLTVIRVADADEAVRVANASRYGLAGGVWSRDLEKARRVARAVRAGTLWVNTYGAVFGDVPFGGYRRSGLGREAGREGYEAYTEAKSILVDTTGGTTAPVF
jgi:aldehyde dehydrogenase (NAD+)